MFSAKSERGVVWWLGKNPWEEMLQPENGVQQERAQKTEQQEASRILSERHLRSGINRSNAIDQPLNRTAKAVERCKFPGKNAFHLSAQGLYEESDDDDEEEVLRSGVEIRHCVTSPARISLEDHAGNCMQLL